MSSLSLLAGIEFTVTLGWQDSTLVNNVSKYMQQATWTEDIFRRNFCMCFKSWNDWSLWKG